MPDNHNRTTEAELSKVVLEILYQSGSGEMSVHDLIRDIPKYVNLTTEDRQQSETRENEEIWEQRVRNITSHHESPGNFIAEGFLEHIKGGLRLTEAGRVHHEHNKS
jgi:glycine cleavage system pyridoxal-binding protein P